jgi:thymidylate kinase
MTEHAWNLSAEEPMQASDFTEAAPPAAADHATDAFLALFASLEAHGIDYCVTHGAEEFPSVNGSDIDIVVAGGVGQAALEKAIRDACDGRNAILAAVSKGVFSVAIRGREDATRVAHLDFSTGCEAAGRTVMRGEEMLAGKRRVGGVFAPAAATDFQAYLARCALKGRYDSRRQERLLRLWREDPQGCAAGLGRFFGPAASEIASAFNAGDPASLAPSMARLGKQVVARTRRAGGIVAMPRGVAKALRLVRGLLFPRGISVVMLGPDGAGKSSNIEALEKGIDSLFPHVIVRGFAPPLHRIVKRGPKRTDTPHALPPRSPLVSVLRAAYWFVYDNWGRLPVRLTKARGGLALFDRHLIDILVDPVRYRYGGPRFVLDLVARFTPRPDLVILLYAPGEVLHARKPEMTLAETQRQSQAYLDLVRTLPNGHVVDASQPFAKVLRDVEDIVIAARAAR